MPICVTQLNHSQINNVRQLSQRCKRIDNNAIPLYINILQQPRHLPLNLLYYRQNKLLGFLSLFFFYKDGCELTLMVDPSHRHQGIATQLLAAITPLIITKNLPAIYFASPKDRNYSHYINSGFSLQNTEIQMRLVTPLWLKIPENITFENARFEHLQILVEMDNVCFASEGGDIDQFNKILDDPNYLIIIIYLNQAPIGKVHLQRNEFGIKLSNMAILPNYQGHGNGAYLINHIIEYVIQNSSLPLILDVDSNNKKAFNLYKKMGFEIIDTWDMWKAPTNTFLNF